MNELDLVGMAQALLRQRDRLNDLATENARLLQENARLVAVLEQVQTKLERIEGLLTEVQEQQT